MLLVIVAANSTNAASQNLRFQFVNLGKGRVPLTIGGGALSASNNVVFLKYLTGKAPGDAESFQWVNLMRGDSMLTSLVNHRYLGAKPNAPGPVTVFCNGPSPDCEGGACFKWKVVE